MERNEFALNFLLTVKPFFFRRLPLALCALSGALFLASCSPSSDNNAVIENTVAENTATENAAPAATSPAQFSVLSEVLVPGKDDLLHKQKVSRMGIDSQLKSGGDAAPALQEIIEKAPAYFPPGAKINSAKSDDKTFVIDLNAAFDKSDFWSSQGEKTTELAVYALVNSIADHNQPKGPTLPVRFTIDKKPAKTLGEFDLEGEIEPQTRLNAK